MTYLSEIYNVTRRLRDLSEDYVRATLKQLYTSEDYVAIPYIENLVTSTINSESNIKYFVTDTSGNFIVAN